MKVMESVYIAPRSDFLKHTTAEDRLHSKSNRLQFYYMEELQKRRHRSNRSSHLATLKGQL